MRTTGTTPFPTRCARLALLAWHLAAGLAIVWLRYPRLPPRQQRSILRRWSSTLLAILGIKVSRKNAPRKWPARCVVICNHISWLDIFVLMSRSPATFVAKSEIRRWPFIGSLCARVGTVFIDRGRSSSARHTNAAISAAIEAGTLVCIYPEGTTTDGQGVARFHSALFQPAIDSSAILQPALLRYVDQQGNICAAPNFVGETTFMQSLWCTVSAPAISAELLVLPGINSEGGDRRALAKVTHQVIADALTRQHAGTQPGKA